MPSSWSLASAQEYADRSPAAARRIEQSPARARQAIIVRADREALALAVRNLLDNAMKYSPDSVARAPRRGANATARSRCRSRIMAPASARRSGATIFRKFTRGAAARSAQRQGHRHRPDDGRSDREGARRTTGAGKRTGREAARSRSCCRRCCVMSRILIVEDEPSIALALEDDLRREGYETEVGRRRRRGRRARRRTAPSISSCWT